MRANGGLPSRGWPSSPACPRSTVCGDSGEKSYRAGGTGNARSVAAVQSVIDTIPNHEFHMLKGAAHWSQWEKPEEVNALTLDFLSRLRVPEPA